MRIGSLYSKGGVYEIGFETPKITFPFSKKTSSIGIPQGEIKQQADKVQLYSRPSFVKGAIVTTIAAGTCLALQFGVKMLGIAALTVSGPYAWAAFAVAMLCIFLATSLLRVAYVPPQEPKPIIQQGAGFYWPSFIPGMSDSIKA